MAKGTRLEQFIRAHRLRPAQIAREAECSRKHLFDIRMGIAEPTRPVLIAITRAVGSLLRRKVRANELFNLGDDTP